MALPFPFFSATFTDEHRYSSSTKYWSDQKVCSVFFHKMALSLVQLLSCVWLFVTPWIAAHQVFLSITNSQSSLKLTSIDSVLPSSHLILCHLLLLLPPIPPSIRVFSNESTFHMRWPKYWNFRLSTISSKEHPGQISFRMDWLDLLAVQLEPNIFTGSRNKNTDVDWSPLEWTGWISLESN